MRKILLIITAFIINMFIMNCSFAENFYIDNYDIVMDVKENRDVEITEVLDVNFTRPSHGIIRTIPLKAKILREDGSIGNEYGKIENVTASGLNSTSINNGQYEIKLGSANRYVDGPVRYEIKYTYKMGNDRLKDADEFYYNIVGNDWETNINRVHFRITMPKDYTARDFGFSTGLYGKTGYDPNFLIINTQGREISGFTTGTLQPREGITIRLVVDDNYFIKEAGQHIETISIAGAMALISFLLWLVYGKDEPVIPVVNFYPPKNRNSAKFEVEYEGAPTDKGVVSLIFYLANKGYLEIEEDEDGEFIIKKLKEYDGKVKEEKIMFDALFTDRNKDEVSEYELKYSRAFSESCSRIRSTLYKIKGYLFDPNACSPKKVMILLAAILTILGTIIYTLGDYTFNMLRGDGKVLIIFPTLAIFMFSIFIRTPGITGKIFISVWAIMFGGIPLMILKDYMQNIESNYPYLIFEFLCLAVGIVCLLNLPKRNKKGRELLGNVLGFKKYLETAEEHRIRQLLNENPNYCDEVLPYAYVLGVADVWLKKLENIAEWHPHWYRGTFNTEKFSRMSRSMSNSASPPSSGSSGSGHSGGGHSGGGHGGGGGHSW